MLQKKMLLSAKLLAIGATIPLYGVEKPNIIFFLVDDMGWMDSTPYGSKYYETPNIDRLAKQGKLFTNAYTASPVSSPTRASIMTGRSPERFQLTTPAGHTAPNPTMTLINAGGPVYCKVVAPNLRTYMPLEEVTIAENLKTAGYATCHIGKWHLGGTSDYFPDKQGFDQMICTGAYAGPPNYFSPYNITGFTNGPDKEYITDRITAEALNYIENHQHTPFYLNMWQWGVHSPWQGTLELVDKYNKKTDPLGKQNCAIMGAMMELVDKSLGEIMDKLEELGMSNNTIIVFTSDNGGLEYETINGILPTNNDPLRGGKGTIYDGGTKVPLIVSWPSKIAPNTKSDELVWSNDYFPTFMQLTGVPADPAHPVDGESILPLLFDQGTLTREAIFVHFPNYGDKVKGIPGTSVRTKDWKLIRYYGEGFLRTNAYELYYIKEDIGETNNLATQYPDTVLMLDALISEHITRTSATIPIVNKNWNPSTVFPNWGVLNVFNIANYPSYYSIGYTDVESMTLNRLNAYARNNSEICIEGDLVPNKSVAEFYDMQGRMVMMKKLDATEPQNTISTSTFHDGVYLLKVTSGKKSSDFKVLISK